MVELEMSYTYLKIHTICQLEEAPPIISDKNCIRGDLYWQNSSGTPFVSCAYSFINKTDKNGIKWDLLLQILSFTLFISWAYNSAVLRIKLKNSIKWDLHLQILSFTLFVSWAYNSAVLRIKLKQSACHSAILLIKQINL